MNVTAIYAGVDGYAEKLDYIFNIFNNTSNELGVNIEKINITKLNIDNFSGKKLTIIDNIFNNIKNSSAVIFVCTAKLLSPCGAMHVFLEHFDQNIYPNILYDKPCYTIITSFDGSEFNAGNYISTVVNSLGGNTIGNMLVGSQYLSGIESSLETTKMIERYAEDFYRLIKQNRKLFHSKPFNINVLSNNNNNNINNQNLQNNNINNNTSNNINNNINNTTNNNEFDFNYLNRSLQPDEKPIKNLNGQQVASLYQKEIDNNHSNTYYSNQNLNIENSNKKYNFNNSNNDYSSQMQNFNSNNDYSSQMQNFNSNKDYSSQIQNFNSYQDDDISEITKLLTNQYNVKNNNSNLDNFNVDTFRNEKMLNGGTCKQRTTSLYHYFQPQIAKDLDINIQINISGEENFNGYFQIKNGECNYFDGVTQNPEVSIISDSQVWEDVLKSKYTLQKAFMLGKVKVKGNFVIISRFEQIFKFN